MITDKPIISLKNSILKSHKLNIEIFGNLNDTEYEDLKSDIEARGIQDPLHVVKQNGEYVVVSGHQRLKVARELGIDLPCIIRTDLVEEWQVEEQLIKDNLLRRHLNDYQKVNAGERLEVIERIKAKEKLIISANLKERTETGQFKSSPKVAEIPPVVEVLKVEPKTRDIVSSQIGMSARQYDNAKKVKYEAPEPIKLKWRSGEISTGTAMAAIKKEEHKAKLEQKQVEKKQELTQPIDITNKKFNVILADPPWRYNDVVPNRSIENHYPTMDLNDICEINIHADDDCILFLWATSPLLPDAIKVLTMWGFEYKTSMVWVKDRIGMGYYARGRHELLLIGIKGNPGKPEPVNRPDSVIEAPRTEHSKKPLIVYDIIEKMYPHGVYLELFSRKERSGWISWGNEINKGID